VAAILRYEFHDLKNLPMIWNSTREEKKLYTPVTIAIIEDNYEKRKNLEKLIRDFDKFRDIKSYSDSEDLIRFTKTNTPSVVIIDVGNDVRKVDSLKKIKKNFLEVNIIAIADTDRSELVFNLINAGACGFILKDAEPQNVMDAIEEAISGGAPLPPNVARMVIESLQKNPDSPLTARETEVLQLLATGKSYSVIADELFIHKETVKSHIKNIYVKLKVKSKADAIGKAIRERLI